ncbi:hypothetical protein MFM001_15780 [Mycobacterium sp. MFM001]|uniref:MmpS family transport accessory protein n=1 Tax=Mycobacterium sp. MFM001 TaxID=2049453 RepID=UPI000DA4C151|nr:MmpS family transport accessory protein [Mycobacterium sp. MFM001]GBE65116.1 hypothetical protein MFM001_15780 [Mycobacterium sp. MFM001]
MNDPRRPEHTRPARPGGEPTERLRQPYSPYNDPAYAGQSPYYQGLPPRPGPTETNPTEKLPQYWLQDQASQQPTTPPPGRPKPPRWLWVAAAAAALLVAALVIALVIANGAARKQTAVAPLPAMPGSKTSGSATSPSSSASAPSSTTTSTSEPSESSETTTSAAGDQTVVYNVSGEGRAISITYVDNGGVMQTEFNVPLPWSKQVSLPQSGDRKANVTIINIGNKVTCTVTVAGVQVREHTGSGLTVCDAPS